MSRGSHGRLLSTPNQLTSSAWVTAATGCGPAHHGVYNFQERVPGEYRLRLPTALDRSLPAFWETASAAGRTVIAARVPMSYPVRPVRGLQVSDWLAPSPHAPGFAYPDTLARDLQRRYNAAFWLEPVDLLHSRSQRHILQGLLDSVDTNFEFFDYLLAREQADLFFGVVRETDIAGHAFWDYLVGRRDERDPDLGEELSGAILQVYQRVDRRLGEMLEHMPPGANLLIVSDHGMGDHPQAPDYLRPLLEEAGLMVRQPAPPPQALGWRRRARNAVAGCIPWHLRRRFRPLDAATWSLGFTQSHISQIDFARSRAFSYTVNPSGEVWLNLQGREPLGMVAPGAPQEELEDAIIEMFVGLHDTATGRPLVAQVWRRDEMFDGPHADIMADLHVQFDADAPVQGVRTRFEGREIEPTPILRPPIVQGFHRPYGSLVACGPAIACRPEPVSGTLRDLAPTALALMGLPVPRYMEGRILSEALAPLSPKHYAPPPPSVAAPTDSGYTSPELARVESRLSGLGYI